MAADVDAVLAHGLRRDRISLEGERAGEDPVHVVAERVEGVAAAAGLEGPRVHHRHQHLGDRNAMGVDLVD